MEKEKKGHPGVLLLHWFIFVLPLLLYFVLFFLILYFSQFLLFIPWEPVAIGVAFAQIWVTWLLAIGCINSHSKYLIASWPAANPALQLLSKEGYLLSTH